MTITTNITGTPGVLQVLGRVPTSAKAALKRTFAAIGFGLVAYIQQRKLSGQVLHARTSRLRSSIHAEPVTEEGGLISVRVGTNVVYARIHEYGGSTRPHIIEAKHGKSLAFWVQGASMSSLIFRRKVRHPGSKMPERSFLRSSMREYRLQAFGMVQKTVDKIVKEAK